MAALHAAARGGFSEAVLALLQRGADKDAVDKSSETSLIKSAAKGHLGVVSTLLAGGADCNICDACGASPLHVAASRGHRTIVSLLIRAGANKDALDNHAATPLKWAAGRGHRATVEVLLAAGADANIRSSSRFGGAPLHAAAYEGHVGVVSALLFGGGDADLVDNMGRTSLIWAAKKGHVAVVDALLEADADVDTRGTDDRYSALDRAAANGHIHIMRAVIRRGADVNARGRRRRTALHIAAENNQAEAVDTLMEAGAALELRTKRGLTPLLAAAAMSTTCTSMRALLRHGAVVTVEDHGGRTPLHWVCRNRRDGVEAAVGLLLRWGADETALDGEGNTPAKGLDLPVEHEEAQCSEGEIERVRAMLARAPADRAWHRRCWLVMLRWRSSKTGTGGYDEEGGSDSDVGQTADSGRDDGSRKVARKECAAHKTQNSAGGHRNMRLGGMAAGLVTLIPEEAFRAVVGFL